VAFDPVGLITRLAAFVPKSRVNLTGYHGVVAPNYRWRGEVTPAKRGKGVTPIANMEDRSPTEHHVPMAWARRLKRVFSKEALNGCGNEVSTALRLMSESTLHNYSKCGTSML